MDKMTKRERLEATFKGQPVDRPAVALWRHWPVDDQKGDTLAWSSLWWQRTWDWDFMKLTPTSNYPIANHGQTSRYLGNNEGNREYGPRLVQKPEDWARLTVKDPTKGLLGEMRRMVQLVQQEAGDTPYIMSIFNPFSQARNLAGDERVLADMREHPDLLRQGLEVLTETTVRFVESIMEYGIAGLFLAVQHASYSMMSEEEYKQWGLPLDLRILQAAQPSWFNLLHLHGNNVMFNLAPLYPVQVVNWHDLETPPSLAEGKQRFGGAVCGGIRQIETLQRGTPEQVTEEVKTAIRQTNGERLIVATGCVTMIVSPISNIRAVRAAVEP